MLHLTYIMLLSLINMLTSITTTNYESPSPTFSYSLFLLSLHYVKYSSLHPLILFMTEQQLFLHLPNNYEGNFIHDTEGH